MKYTMNQSQYQFIREGFKPFGKLVPDMEILPKSEEDLQNLISKKYMSEQYVVNKELGEAFKVLTKPQGIQRVGLINLDSNFEIALYCGNEPGALVAMYDTQEGVVIESPYENASTLEGLSQYTGQSIIKSTEVNWHLTSDEALIITGLIDLERRSIGRTGVWELESSKITKHELMTSLDEESSVNDLRTYILALTEAKVSPESLDVILRGLLEKELIEMDEHITLSGEAMGIALRFFSVKNMIRISTGYDSGSQTYGSELVILQDGVTDLLSLDVRSDSVLIRSVSSLEILDLLNAYNEDPQKWLKSVYGDLKKSAQVSEAKVQVAEENVFCVKCGTKKVGEARFCSKCGNNIEDQ